MFVNGYQHQLPLREILEYGKLNEIFDSVDFFNRIGFDRTKIKTFLKLFLRKKFELGPNLISRFSSNRLA